VSKVEAFIANTRALPLIRANADQRTNRIRAAVIEECMEKSFRHASMARIAKRAHVSTASLYREFPNRDALLANVAKFAGAMIAGELTPDMGLSNPLERLRKLLFQHSQIFQNPYATWLYRAHVSGEIFEDDGMAPLGKVTRERIESFWANEIKSLQYFDQVSSSHLAEIVNFVLGGVQRRTLSAMFLFGPDDQADPKPEAAIDYALDWVSALYRDGACSKHLGQIDVANLSTNFSDVSKIERQVLSDLTSHRERNDVAGRHQKILAAAVQECSQMGFKAASMAGVAERANVSTATLYDHFADKEDMFVKSVAYMVPFLTEAVTKAPKTTNPREQIAQLLINHGQAYIDPFMSWLYRLYVSFDGHNASTAVRLGRASRAMTEQFWHDQLSRLESEGYLQPSDHALTINILLGCVERRTLVSLLMYGFETSYGHDLLDAAVFAAQALFQHLGTEKFAVEFGRTARTVENA
jgi:AcrR family transcriptional regulator